jgi:dTDP-4-amino-4,6-dideoxygalactose transaminase
MKIPFVSFDPMHKPIKAEMMKAFEDFYDSNWYVLGEKVKQFETEYARFNQIEHVVGVSNGLDAIFVALKALGIGEGDEVVVPANTYIATWLAVTYTGATPIPVEPDIDTYNIDTNLIETVVTNKTKAIIPVHLYGQPCNMDSVMQIANKYKLFVVEDNAQSQGATFKRKLTGSFGIINATSFYPGKNLGALGDAGAITTNSEMLANSAQVLRNYGSKKKYYTEQIGYNMRLDECQAAFLQVKLKHLSKWNQQRIEIAKSYLSRLCGVGDIVLPKTLDEATHVYHLFVIRTKHRDTLQKYLTDHGIGTMVHYPIPPHLQEAYSQYAYKKGDFPLTEEIANTCLSLPIWPGMTSENIDEVIERIINFYSQL